MLEDAGLVLRHRQGRYTFHQLDTTPLGEIARRWPTGREGLMPRITVTSVLVDDQDKALRFYTDVLGFVKKTEVPMGDHRWLTVVGPGEPDGVELLLEPDAHPASRVFKEALVADGIPYTSFGVDDTRAEHARLVALGVRFTQDPLEMGPVVTAVLDDTCGNLIQIASMV